jgi:hypothetical protein
MQTPTEKPTKEKARILTDVDFKRATCPPGKNRHRLSDSGGLYLEVSPSGSKRWFWKLYPDGKESRLALGVYPAVTLKAARQARDTARKLRDTKAPTRFNSAEPKNSQAAPTKR